MRVASICVTKLLVELQRAQLVNMDLVLESQVNMAPSEPMPWKMYLRRARYGLGPDVQELQTV